ncbi:demethylmenaquinone methyltransferase [Actinocatenispora rupis]|uniref:Demethylmenaquinone methyltransferase n=1 Tax=Actinocatenispora rupis TaxID=519421 RepID=A0A8J3JGT8_9ACTN|nr:demethylmenaquinone methyltransferase [Actinocatenispora rupis]GID15643.1 demethylmenaquinone methyltransferase [Actinocatenispora rupis]
MTEQHGTRATLDKKPREVAAMFDDIAERYDLTNTVIAMGQDRLWRRATRRALGLQPGDRCLDVAAGTAVSTVELARSGAEVVACDFSLGMLRRGQRAGRTAPRVAGDAMALPFADHSFDAVTITFGLRNVSDIDAAIAEFARVTRPGGRLVICEFSHPTFRPFRVVYEEYLVRALPIVAGRIGSNPAGYEYLPESVQAWPEQADLATRIGAAGWTDVAWRNLSGGIVALHRATRR